MAAQGLGLPTVGSEIVEAGQHPADDVPEAAEGLEDPWNLVRLAMGSMAGEHWRVRQALVWPREAFQLRDLPEGSTWWEQYQLTQTYDAFCRAIPFRPNCTNISVELVVVGSQESLEKAIDLDVISAHLEVFLGLSVKRRTTPIKFGPWAQLRRSSEGYEQVNADAILTSLGSSVDIRSTCTLGLTSKDLYTSTRGFDYVTGLTGAMHRVGIYSTSRYFCRVLGADGSQRAKKEEEEGSYRDELSLILIKVLSRECLKLCGASECHLVKCLMNPVRPEGEPQEALAAHPLELCCICLRKLHWITQADPLDRLARLPSVLSSTFVEESTRIWERMRQIGLPTYASYSDPDPLNKRTY